ncbi:MAG: glutathione synthase [Cyanobacteria bacterium]|nr:glutathione synthase [Cyanobacteriota bacterium]
MRLAFFVTDLNAERPQYLTYRLAMTALNRGHEVFHFGASDLTYWSDDEVRLSVRSVPKNRYSDQKAYFADLIGTTGVSQHVKLDELDILMLRSDPSLSQDALAWRQTIGLQIGQLAHSRGVLVLNNPTGLAGALNKMYLQSFPQSVRPYSIITRSAKDIRSFAQDQKGPIILKPVQGSSGKGVFLVDKGNPGNLNQIVETLSRDGYIIAQEYIPEATAGDTRMFLVNGRPLQQKGKYAAFRRRRAAEDIRSNVHVGGTTARAEITDEILELVEKVRPRLVRDGMFVVGLDIVGNKILEINVFCPGGLGNIQRLEGIDFTSYVVDKLEQKNRMASHYRRGWFKEMNLASL